jgi:GT2 family glycosyltransferase
MSPRVLVTIVTYNSARFLAHCLESLRRQEYRDFSAAAWDNASEDSSPELLADAGDLLDTSHFSARNLGFCAGHNQLIRSMDSEYVLVLNPDVVLDSAFLKVLVSAMEADPASGSATGKLWRWDGVASPMHEPSGRAGRILDSTGIYFTRNQRHLDRGSGEVDTGRYERREYVFGASGAAALYRRRMLDEIAAGGEYFDESFFAYREDADLAWRAQWLGWRCLYVPEARAFHVRNVLPERRAALAAEINMHSFKNRFLLRLKNMDAGTYFRMFFPITARDLLALAYVLARERSSLRAFPLILRAAPRAWATRNALRRHRRVKPVEMRTWFCNRPVSRPLRP